MCVQYGDSIEKNKDNVQLIAEAAGPVNQKNALISARAGGGKKNKEGSDSPAFAGPEDLVQLGLQPQGQAVSEQPAGQGGKRQTVRHR